MIQNLSTHFMTLGHAVLYAFVTFPEVPTCLCFCVTFSERHSLTFPSVVPTENTLPASIISYLSTVFFFIALITIYTYYIFYLSSRLFLLRTQKRRHCVCLEHLCIPTSLTGKYIFNYFLVLLFEIV